MCKISDCESYKKNSSLHAGVGSHNVCDWSSADGALEALRLQLKSALHTHTHVPTPVHDRVDAGL